MSGHKLFIFLTRKRQVILILIAITALTMLMAFASKKESANTSVTPVSVRLKWFHQSQFAGMYIAKDKGIYKDYGVDVSLKERDVKENLGVFKEVEEGKATFGIVNGVEFLKQVSEGRKIKAVAVMYQVSPATLVTLKKNTLRTPPDLKGKRLATAGGEAGETVALYRALMKRYGIEQNEVTYKDSGFLPIDSILQREDVDIATISRTSGTFILNKAGIKYTPLYPEDFGVRAYDDVIITSEAFLSNHPDVVSAFVKATIMGWEYTFSNSKEALQISRKYANSRYQDEKYLAHILEKSMPLIKTNSGKSIGNMSYVRWKEMYDMLLFEGIVKKPFNVEDVYTTEFLD